MERGDGDSEGGRLDSEGRDGNEEKQSETE